MNAARRKEIDKAIGFLQEATAILETCQSEEQDFYDNMPENMQSGDKGDAAQAAADALQSAVDGIDEVLSNCESAKE